MTDMIDDLLEEIKSWEGDILSQCESISDNKDKIIAALAAIKKLQTDGGWFEIDDAADPALEGMWILGSHKYKSGISGSELRHCEIVCWSNSNGGFWQTNLGEIYNPTHWKPLDAGEHVNMLIEREIQG